jgi:hypothetical protein
MREARMRTEIKVRTTLLYFMHENPEVLGSTPSATRFAEWQWVWNGVHSALVRINEGLLERKVAAPV